MVQKNITLELIYIKAMILTLFHWKRSDIKRDKESKLASCEKVVTVINRGKNKTVDPGL